MKVVYILNEYNTILKLKSLIFKTNGIPTDNKLFYFVNDKINIFFNKLFVHDERN